MAKKLTIYQTGALTHFELVKKAKKVPAFGGFLDPKIFFMSFGWFQTKKKRGYSEDQCAQFIKGFKDAARLAAEDRRADQAT